MFVVLDTSVVIAGLRSRNGASKRLLSLVAHERLKPLVTTTLFLEYEAVLKRPETRLATGLSLAEIDQFIAAFASTALGVESYYAWRPYLKDADDDMVLECAVNGQAQYLVTHNLRDFLSVENKFKFSLVNPGEILRIFQEEKS